MAPDAPLETAEPAPAPRPRGMSLPRRVSFFGFASLVVLAVAFYIWWGVSFGVWFDNGVYAVFITLLLFGLAGMWLMLPNPPNPAPSDS
jgi:apolipoprotein N-acyltransferase